MTTKSTPANGADPATIAAAMGHLSQFIALMAGGAADQGGAGWPATMGVKKACEYLDIGETKFRELVKAGEIPRPFDLGGRPHWLRGDLDAFIRQASRGR